MSSAAIIIIGNEILTGKFADENGPYLIRRLRDLGVDLVRLTVIPDVIEVIAREVREASAAVDHVFTTGGVGPTHDDLTMLGIAAAFDTPLERHPELAGIIEAHMRARAERDGEPLASAALDAALRMADIPAGAALWWDGPVRFPLVVARNVAIFPGVPELLRLKFEAVAARFTGAPLACRRVWTADGEPTIAARLTEASQRWPTVAIGSYPRFELVPPHVLVTLESRSPDDLAACAAFVEAGIRVVDPPVMPGG